MAYTQRNITGAVQASIISVYICKHWRLAQCWVCRWK